MKKSVKHPNSGQYKTYFAFANRRLQIFLAVDLHFTDGEDVVLHVAVSHDLDPQVASYRPGGAGHVHNLSVNPRANKLSACNWE